MMRIPENNLMFSFGDKWNDTALKFDNHHDYRKVSDVLENTKGMDFLGILHGELFFIEVKDFRGYRIQNKKRLSTGRLGIEVGQKVRDSVACLIGASRVSGQREVWQRYVNILYSYDSRVRVVLWLEEDQTQRRNIVKYDVLRKDMKRRLKWLGVKINVYSLRQPAPEQLDLRVANRRDRH